MATQSFKGRMGTQESSEKVIPCQVAEETERISEFQDLLSCISWSLCIPCKKFLKVLSKNKRFDWVKFNCLFLGCGV